MFIAGRVDGADLGRQVEIIIRSAAAWRFAG
jgi:hypothetical protein